MTYVARVPEVLSRWTIATSLSPDNWTPSSDSELIRDAQQLLKQIQTAIDHMTLQAEENTEPSTAVFVNEMVSTINLQL